MHDPTALLIAVFSVVLFCGAFAVVLCIAAGRTDRQAQAALARRRRPPLQAIEGIGEEVAEVSWLYPDHRPELTVVQGGDAA
jgi:hypothetical protein